MLKFRSAEIQDQSQLNQISIASKKHWGYPDDWIAQWSEDLLISRETLIKNTVKIAQVDERIIGFCCILEEKEYLEIEHLWILPEFIGKGYGKDLLNYTLGCLSHKGKPIQVVSDPNAEEFYKKQGFKTIGKIESYPKSRFLSVLRKG
ncbi:MAG: GNAT family N-acetyltransferase [Lutimonas sp.]